MVTRSRGMHGGHPTECTRDRLPGSETSVVLPGRQKLYVRRSHVWPEPHHDELHTFRRETERRRLCGNEGWIRAVAESHCRHDMMIAHPTGRYAAVDWHPTAGTIGRVPYKTRQEHAPQFVYLSECHHQHHLTSNWDVGLFLCSIQSEGRRHHPLLKKHGLGITNTSNYTALFQISHSSQTSSRGLWLLVWRSTMSCTVRSSSVWEHASGIQSGTLYWNCCGQRRRTISWLPLCYWTSPQHFILIIIQSNILRRDSTCGFASYLGERTLVSSTPTFDSAIRWTATGSVARKRSCANIVHDL